MDHQNAALICKMSDLSDEDRNLCEKSIEAMAASYSPYSQFAVGSAVVTADGTVFKGCNVENSSYGLAICAERTALVKAVSEGKREFKKIAVCANLGDQAFCTPCGACRQFMIEFNQKLPVYLVRPGDRMVRETRIDFLMPDTFNKAEFVKQLHVKKLT